MYEELDDKNSHQRVLSLSLAYIPRMDRHAIQISVPLGVALQNGLVIQTDNFTSTALHFRRCDRQGCYVEMVLDNASIDSLSKSGPDGKIKIVADGGKPFDLPPVAQRLRRRAMIRWRIPGQGKGERAQAGCALDRSAPAP